MMTKIYCFGTENSDYYQMALKCAERFALFNIKVEVIATKNHNDWMKNILERAKHFKKIADQNKDIPIGWIDADIFPLKDPISIKNWDSISYKYDIGVTLRPGAESYWNRICAGVVLFPSGSRVVLDQFVNLCNEDYGTDPCREQIYLMRATSGNRVFDLGIDYNSPTYQDDNTVIYHSDQPNKPQYEKIKTFQTSIVTDDGNLPFNGTKEDFKVFYANWLKNYVYTPDHSDKK